MKGMSGSVIVALAFSSAAAIFALASSGQSVVHAQQVSNAQPSSSGPLLSEQAFKNVQALKDIPVDDFLGTMGIMSAALGFDCSECHVNAGTDTVDWAADTPRKRTARRMVDMVTAINRSYFPGRQQVTCWTCHRGRDRPMVTPTMERVYGTATFEEDDIVTADQGASAAKILDRYIEAVGGPARLAAVTSYVGRGTSVSFGGLGGNGQVAIYAKAPDKRTMVINYKDAPGRGDTTRSYNGAIGWVRTPMNVLGEYQLSGSELDGARVDALLSFPGQIKQMLSNARAGAPTTISDLPTPAIQLSVQPIVMFGHDRDVQVVQGTGPRGLLVTLYFDTSSGLLLRMIRYGGSPIGRVPTQIDFEDYRETAGVKVPFRMTFAWLDGRDAIQLDEVRTNAPIDDAVFGRPAPLPSK